MKGLLRFLFSITIGLFYGLLFAQKPGQKLRSELKKSKSPAKDLFKELKSVDREAIGSISDWAKNSEELQKVLESGKEQFDVFVEKVKELGKDAVEVAEKELEEMSVNAKKAAIKLKKQAVKKGATMKKTTTKRIKTFKNELDKKVKQTVKKRKTTPKKKKTTTKKS
ncbi:YtxH domain-containing protein [Candidatus Gracilibacteria bacterium]|nr:YtxH domain-containing protein [Candidatus Gracilibacteria bacterium]